MAKSIDWRDVIADMDSNADQYRLSEKLFAMVEGGDWPLYGPYREAYDDDRGSYDYLGDVDLAAQAATKMFAGFVWDKPDWEPEISLQRVQGVWSARVTVDAEHAAALSQNGINCEIGDGGRHALAGGAIMRAAAGLYTVLKDARPEVDDDASPSP